MDTTRLLDLIHELHDMQVFMLTLGGGEPFLHPDILSIVKLCSELDIHTAILTNGTLLSDECLKDISRLISGKLRFLLQISLDSPISTINNQTRGMGDVASSAIFKATNLGIQVQVASVLTRINIETAHQTIDHFYPQVTKFHFNNLQPTQRSLNHKDLFPSREQTIDFWIRLEEYMDKYPDLQLPSLKPNLFTYDSSRRDGMQATFNPACCCVALTQAEISSAFEVYGCDIAKEFSSIGNVGKKSFKEVWNSEAAYNARSSEYPLCEMRERGCSKTNPI